MEFGKRFRYPYGALFMQQGKTEVIGQTSLDF